MVGVTKYCKLQYKMLPDRRDGSRDRPIAPSNPIPSEPLQINLFGEFWTVKYGHVSTWLKKQLF